jgi:hypothetical protein
MWRRVYLNRDEVSLDDVKLSHFDEKTPNNSSESNTTTLSSDSQTAAAAAAQAHDLVLSAGASESTELSLNLSESDEMIVIVPEKSVVTQDLSCAEHIARVNGARRQRVYHGELIQFYVVLRRSLIDRTAWLQRENRRGGYNVDVRVQHSSSNSGTGSTALSHFHADAHSAPSAPYASQAPTLIEMWTDNGDCVLAMQTILSIGQAHDDRILTLYVMLKQELHSELNEAGDENPDAALEQLSAYVRSIHRTATEQLSASASIYAVQPLQLSSSDTAVGRTVCLSIEVRNSMAHVPISVRDFELHLNRTRYTLRDRKHELSTIPLGYFFKLHCDKGDLPITLKPKEAYSFVMFLEPISVSSMELAQLSSNFSTLYSITWACADLSVPVVLQQKITWAKPSHHNIMLTMKSKSIRSL